MSNLRWQRNRNAEVGVDLRIGGTSVSLVGYFKPSDGNFCINGVVYPDRSVKPQTAEMGKVRCV